MTKELKITLKVDAKTGEITAVKNSFDSVDKTIQKTNTDLEKLKERLVAAVSITAAIYGLGKAIGFVVESGFDYNKSMDASTAKLTAMISASKGYETVAGEQVTALQRQKLIAAEVSDMMDILKTTNAQTAMGMSELVDIYALAKPGMDRYKWSVKDQIEIVKLASNTASNFGMTAEELSSGIDDLAAGTWETSSGFGKMMKSLGVSKEEFKATGDKVAYLKEKMQETGAAQDTWAVAVSNFQVAWDNMAGQVTQPIFDGVKKAIKYITDQMSVAAPDAMQVFSNALVDLVNGGISVISTLIGWISKMVSGFQIAYQGYVKLYAMANGGTVSNISKLKSEVAGLNEELNKKDPYAGVNPFNTFRDKSEVVKDLITKTRELQEAEAALEDRRKADQSLENIATFDEKMQNIAATVKNIVIKKGAVSSGIQETIDPANQLAYKLNAVGDANDKKTKSDTKAGAAAKDHAKELRDAAQASDDLYRKYLELTGQQEKLFSLDVEKTLKEFMNAGYSGEQLSQIYDAMWEKYIDKGKHANKDIAEDFAQRFQDIAANIFSGVTDSLRNGGSINQALAEADIGVQFADALKSSGNPYAVAAGYAIEMIGALFSDFASQAEIDAATGRVDFTDESLKNMGSMFENVMNPQLKETHTIARLTGQLNDKFSLIARAITGTLVGTGVDLTGVDYTPTAKYGFAGFSSKTIDLLGTGLDFSGTLSNIDVQGYISELIKKSSFWGLSKSSKVRISNVDLPVEAVQAINDVMSDGIESILVAGTTLGFDADAMKARLEAYVIDIGKVNLTDLSASEVQEKLASVFSEIFSGAIDTLDTQITSLVSRYGAAGEGSLETLTRIAVEYNQGFYAFDQINKQFIDGIYERTETITNEVSTTGYKIFGKYYDSLDGINAYMRRFASEVTTTTTETATRIVQDTYTAQMQILDIIESIGGMDNFNDVYRSFVSGFYTDAEQLEMQRSSLRQSFAALGYEMGDADWYKDLILGFEVTDEASAKLYAELFSLSGAMAQLESANQSLLDSEKALLQERIDTIESYRNKISDLFLSEYSPLNMLGKIDFANNTDYTTDQATQEQRAFSALETAYKFARTEEDYRDEFNNYRNILEKTAERSVSLADLKESIDKGTAEYEKTTGELEKIVDLHNIEKSLLEDQIKRQTDIITGLRDVIDQLRSDNDGQRIEYAS